MARSLGKIACTVLPCTSSDGMETYENDDGTVTGYCWVCHKYDSDPLGSGGGNSSMAMPTQVATPTAGQVDRVHQVHAYGDADISERSILPTVVQHFGVKQDPQGLKHYYPYFKGNQFSGYKERVKVTKDFYAVGDQKDVDLFGQAQAAAAQNHRLVITGGELDTLATFQMLWEYQQKSNDEYKDRLPSVVSLAHGEGSSLRDFAGKEEFFDRFTSIVLCYDQDKAGEEGVQDALAILPMNKTLVAHISEKDPCDMLMKGKAKEFCQEILFKATAWKPTTVMTVDDAYEDAVAMPTFGLSWPFPSLTEATEGMKRCDVTGVLAGVGVGKCHRAGTRIHMYNGTTKAVQFVREGELLMGPDSKPRRVLSTTKGRGPMYEIQPIRGASWGCNDAHVLSLKVSDPRYGEVGSVTNISVKEYLLQSKRWRNSHKLWKTGVEYKAQATPCDPYIVGVYLGDGVKNSTTPIIHLGEKKKPVIEYLRKWAQKQDLSLRETLATGCTKFSISQRGVRGNKFKRVTETLTWGNSFRHIPESFLINTEYVRLQLLAGILDTDGWLTKDTYEITCKDRTFGREIEWLSMSLGFYTHRVDKIVNGKTYQRITLSGNVVRIPTLRHQPQPRRQKKDPLVTGFSVEDKGEGNYYGFTLDGDHLYLIEDFQVTHNTTFWHKIISHITMVHNEPCGLFFLEESPGDTLKNLATHLARKRFTSAKANFTQEELSQTVSSLRDRVFLFKWGGQTLQDEDPWDVVKSNIKYMVLVKGCKHIVVDPLTALIAHLHSSEANDRLNSIMVEVEGMCKVLDFNFYYGAHLNPPKDGKPHEEGGRVRLAQATGSKAMNKWSHNILGLERDTQAECTEERNTTTTRMLKARAHGKLIYFPVYYNENDGSFEEITPRELPPSTIGSTMAMPGVK